MIVVFDVIVSRIKKVVLECCAGIEPASVLTKENFGLLRIKSKRFSDFPSIEYSIDFFVIPIFRAWLYFLQCQNKGGVFYFRPFIHFEISACFYSFRVFHVFNI